MSTKLQIVGGFSTGNDIVFDIDNPDTSLDLASHVDSLESYAVENNIFTNDVGAVFTGFKSAKIMEEHLQNKTVSETGGGN